MLRNNDPVKKFFDLILQEHLIIEPDMSEPGQMVTYVTDPNLEGGAVPVQHGGMTAVMVDAEGVMDDPRAPRVGRRVVDVVEYKIVHADDPNLTSSVQVRSTLL